MTSSTRKGGFTCTHYGGAGETIERKTEKQLIREADCDILKTHK